MVRPLHLLRDADRNRGASDALEHRLRTEFRQRQAVQRRRRWLRWTGAIAASIIAAAVVWQIHGDSGHNILPRPDVLPRPVAALPPPPQLKASVPTPVLSKPAFRASN